MNTAARELGILSAQKAKAPILAKAMRAFKIWRAGRRLEKLIRARRDSYEVESYRRHRAAALKARRT